MPGHENQRQTKESSSVEETKVARKLGHGSELDLWALKDITGAMIKLERGLWKRVKHINAKFLMLMVIL